MQSGSVDPPERKGIPGVKPNRDDPGSPCAQQQIRFDCATDTLDRQRRVSQAKEISSKAPAFTTFPNGPVVYLAKDLRIGVSTIRLVRRIACPIAGPVVRVERRQTRNIQRAGRLPTIKDLVEQTKPEGFDLVGRWIAGEHVAKPRGKIGLILREVKLLETDPDITLAA
jgi:hypothetical protein